MYPRNTRLVYPFKFVGIICVGKVKTHYKLPDKQTKTFGTMWCSHLRKNFAI